MASDLRPFCDFFAEPTRNGLTRPKSVRGAGVKMVNMGELFANDRIRKISMDRVPLSDAERNSLLRSGDLLFARQSLVLAGAGKCAIFLGDNDPVTFESHVIRVRIDDRKADPLFFFYYFRSPEGRARIESIVEQGAGASGIRASDLSRLLVPDVLPGHQRAIAHILGSLDDKIELNRRMNETLEGMARAIFKSWFVDFDPVRAKTEGRRPVGMDAATAALFPSSFETGSESTFPRGWRWVSLRDITAKIGSGATPTGGSKVYSDTGVSFIRSQNVYDFRFVWDGLAHIEPEHAERLDGVTIQPNDVLINITGASFLRTCVVDPDVLPARVNQHVAIVRAISGVSPRFIHLHLVSPWVKEFLTGHDAGGSRQAITKAHLEGVPILLPAQPVLDAFATLSNPWFELIEAIARESRTLTDLRDILLPALLSGELHIEDAEHSLPGGA